MKLLKFVLFFSVLLTSGCEVDNVFPKQAVWNGHWRQVTNPDMFFSSGSRPTDPGQRITPQYIISNMDTIFSTHVMSELEDYDSRERWKLILTKDKMYFRIQEISEFVIEVEGPSSSIKALEGTLEEYTRLMEGEEVPFPDSVLYVPR